MDPNEVAAALLVEQIMLRALMREVVMRLAQQSPNPAQAIREIGESLQKCVDGQRVKGADQEVYERAKEGARMNVDTLIKSLDRNG